METLLAVIGTVPDTDTGVFKKISKQFGIDICYYHGVPSVPELSRTTFNAFVTYECISNESIMALFTAVPGCGTDALPVFAVIPSGGSDDALYRFPFTAVFDSPISLHDGMNIGNAVASAERRQREFAKILDDRERYFHQRKNLLSLSTALSAHYDLGTLLDIILKACCDTLGADAGSIYIRERLGPGRPFVDKLRFKVSLNHTVSVPSLEEFCIDIDSNRIAGYVALTGQLLSIDDVYELGDDVPYRYSRDFDTRFNYRMKSMIAVALKNEGDVVVGVLQLMNKKRNPKARLFSSDMVAQEVISFNDADEVFIRSIGSIAAVAIERTQLYENIEQIFEGFVSSSIAAIDERDKVTSGHSRRVMEYALAFIDCVNKQPDGFCGGIRFLPKQRQVLKFAALLHDIGKIGVPENILTKEHRLQPAAYQSLVHRFDFIAYSMRDGRCSHEGWARLEDVENDRAFIEKLNRAGYASEQDLIKLAEIKDKKYCDYHGVSVPILSCQEFQSLAVVRGNLTADERKLMNSHASSTYRILSQIAWNQELERIPEVAAHHHEMVDGSGYPDGLKGDAIPLESKILTVVDIYDALVAQDRPYKPAMPSQKALDILRDDAKKGRLDASVVSFFIDKKVYELVDESSR